MDATTEKPDAASTEAPEAEEHATTDTPTEPDAAPSDADDRGYQILDQLKICYVHIHAGLRTRNKKEVAQFLKDFDVFLANYQRGTTALPIDDDCKVEVDQRIHRWPSRRTTLGMSIHMTDFLTDEQCEAFDEALYDMLKSQPLAAWGRWHEGGFNLEMGVMFMPPAS